MNEETNFFVGCLSVLVSAIFTVWFIYLLIKIAVHVEAWPFG